MYLLHRQKLNHQKTKQGIILLVHKNKTIWKNKTASKAIQMKRNLSLKKQAMLIAKPDKKDSPGSRDFAS